MIGDHWESLAYPDCNISIANSKNNEIYLSVVRERAKKTLLKLPVPNSFSLSYDSI